MALIFYTLSIILALLAITFNLCFVNCSSEKTSEENNLEVITQFLHRVTRTVDLEAAGVDLQNINHPARFFGLAAKWKFGLWVKPFTLYSAKLQYAFPINIPFNVFRPGINPPVLFKREGETGDDDSQLQELHRRHRREARFERNELYKSLESIMNNYGLPAKQCVLRAICEVAEIPFEESLLGDTLNVLMKASVVGRPEKEDDQEYNHYIDAEEHGKSRGSCHKVYANCTESIFSIIPGLNHEIVSDF